MALACAALLGACGGASGPDGSGPAVGTQAQSIQFAAPPMLDLGASATVSATASSGLPVRYTSHTPSVCSVDASSGVVQALSTGTCTVAASQDGDATWAPAPRTTLDMPVRVNPHQEITFGVAPILTVGGTATVSASADSGLPVTFASQTPSVCSVHASSGQVSALAEGDCIIRADQAGDAHYQPAQATLRFAIDAATQIVPPGAPQQVSARAGDQTGTVVVNAGHVDSGGGTITQYTVISSPPGVSQDAATLPVTVTCPALDCSGYAFAISAANSAGSGPASALVDTLTDYDVVVQFKEPDYLHDMTEFHGQFRYNATQRSVSNLQGELSEVMAGNNQPNAPYPDGMPLLLLRHQLSSIAAPPSAGDGLLVTSFMWDHTRTLSDDVRDGGSDGWSPGTGGWKYWGYAHGTRTAPNPGNAYIRIFVHTANPALPLTQAQIDTLAYADCAPEGMMGDDCMTGTTRAGYGTPGSMRGYPISQVVTRRP